jgi:hypothetical protein
MSDKDPDAALQASLRAALHAELAQTDPAAGLAQLHARLRADTAHAPLRTQPDWRAALRGWFTQWPTALASLVIVLQAGLLAWQAQPPVEGVAWRGTEVNVLGNTAVLRVRFAPQAPLQAVTTLLHQLQADVLAGPDADSLWTLTVPAGQHDAALAQLRASPLVQAATAP